MTATGGKHRPEKPLRKLRQLAKSSREDQPCRSLRKLPVNQSHESPSPLHKSIRKFVHAQGEKPSPEQVKALALRMAEQRERAAEDPTQDMNRPEPSGDELLDLSEPEDLGESGPFEERSAPRTKADLLREIRQRADRRTGQQEAEQRQIDPWQVQPPQRRGHGR